MTETPDSSRRQKIIAEAIANCQEARESLSRRMPERFEKICTVVRMASKGEKIRAEIAHITTAEQEKAHAVETIQKYLDIAKGNSVVKQSVKTLLERHKH